MADSRTIRPAKLADAPTLARLYRAAYRPEAERGFRTGSATADRADLERWIRNARLYVAVENGTLAGSIRYRAVGKADDGAPEFGRLAVPPRFQGEGIGSALIERVESVARRDGNDRMRLRTFARHPFLPAFYRRRGYRGEKCTRRPSRSFDVLHMVKAL